MRIVVIQTPTKYPIDHPGAAYLGRLTTGTAMTATKNNLLAAAIDALDMLETMGAGALDKPYVRLAEAIREASSKNSAMACENCGNTKLDIRATRTADMSSAWQDDDGTWYKGPSEESKQIFCSHCKWTAHETRTRGKLTSRTTVAGDQVENDAKA